MKHSDAPLPGSSDELTTQRSPRQERWLRLALFAAGGALVGFGYYYFVGCRSGTCPLTSDPYISSAYGSLVGLLLAWR